MEGTDLLNGGVADFLDELTEDMIDLLTYWNDFFVLLHKKNPTQEEKESAQGLADKAVKKLREVLGNVTPKTHVSETHAPKCFLEMPSGLFRLLIEQWLERNHQDGKKLEAQHQHMSNVQQRAESIGKREHQKHHPLIEDRIKAVHAKGARGNYAKRSADTPEPQANTPARTHRSNRRRSDE